MTVESLPSVEEMLADRSIAGHVALVTGGGNGMGQATSELFAAAGAKVAIADRDLERAEAVVATIRARGGDARAWHVELSQPATIAPLVEAAARHFGRLDIVVNNAGIGRFAALDDPRYQDVWDVTLAVNLASHQHVVRAALPYLKQSPAGRIVNIASVEGLGASATLSAYSASKGGVVALTRGLAVELGPLAITANCICPGPIETDMTSRFTDEMRDNFGRRRTALGRFGLAIEVAQMTLNLCLPASRYVTGAIIPVDGGMMARNT